MSEAKADFRQLSCPELLWRSGRDSLPMVLDVPQQLRPAEMTAYIARQRDDILSAISQYGAIVIRGASYSDAADLADVGRALALEVRSYPAFTDNYRKPVAPGVVASSSVAAGFPVPPHTEHDTVAALNALSPSIRGLLLGCSFVKTVSHMSTAGLQANFGTLERRAIDETCAAFGVEATWRRRNISFILSGPCLVRHPTTREEALSCFWTAATLHFFFRQYHHLPGASQFMSAVCRTFPCWLVTALLRNAHPYFRHNYRYSFIKHDKVLQLTIEQQLSIERAVWNNTTAFHWEEGDILLIDNIKVAHSRLPYIAPRSIVASVFNYYDALPLALQPTGGR